MQFTPLKDFTDGDLRSTYLVGLTYTIRARKPDPKIEGDKGTPMNQTPLFAKVQQWLKEGKVALGPAPVNDLHTSAAEARVEGEGTVE